MDIIVRAVGAFAGGSTAQLLAVNLLILLQAPATHRETNHQISRLASLNAWVIAGSVCGMVEIMSSDSTSGPAHTQMGTAFAESLRRASAYFAFAAVFMLVFRLAVDRTSGR